MKMIKKHLRILRPVIFIGIGLAFAFIGASIGSINSLASNTDLGAAAFYQIQIASPTPTATPISVPGSTDQIMLMGIVITIIVTLPVLFYRSTWTNK